MSIFSKLLCFRRRQNKQTQATPTGSIFSRIREFKSRIYIGIRRRGVVIPIIGTPPSRTEVFPRCSFTTALQRRFEEEEEEEEDREEEVGKQKLNVPDDSLRDFVEKLRANEPYLADYIADIVTKINTSKRKFC